jgi:hypothetical protein
MPLAVAAGAVIISEDFSGIDSLLPRATLVPGATFSAIVWLL